MTLKTSEKIKLTLPLKYFNYADRQGWIKRYKGKLYLMKGLGAPYLVEVAKKT